jgi:hypothetical protein
MRTREELPTCLTQSSFGASSEKEGLPCWYEYPINPIKHLAKISHTHPLRKLMSSSVNPKPETSPLGTCPYVQCQHMCHDRPQVCDPDPCTPMLLWGLALISNVTLRSPRGGGLRGRVAFLKELGARFTKWCQIPWWSKPYLFELLWHLEEL